MSSSTGIAELWHRIAAAKPRTQAMDHRPGWGEWDGIASPGYVGARYQRLLFLANNPGSGGPEPNASERRLFSGLEALHLSPAAFETYNRIHGEVMWEWKISRYIEALQAPRDSFAFINLVKWRGTINAALRQESWPWTQQQLQLLSPERIIVLGKGPYLEFCRAYSGNARVDWIERTRGDQYETPQAARQISDLRLALRA